MRGPKHLVVLGCSATKLTTAAPLPALARYDGPFYRVVRSFLRRQAWPQDLSFAVLSAEFGLIGALAPIPYYDRRMNAARAHELRDSTSELLSLWGQTHQKMSFVLGKDYLDAVNFSALPRHIQTKVFAGGIGTKLNALLTLLNSKIDRSTKQPLLPAQGRPRYFLPDWDDFLDLDYNFAEDKFSHEDKGNRREAHPIVLMRPDRISDGVLISLAQNSGTKGLLKRFGATDLAALAPTSIRKRYGLLPDQWAFGDCGAFSYVDQAAPAITTQQALSLYQLYGVDLGASVDHIPVPEIELDGKITPLSRAERRERVKLTRNNAEQFLQLHRAGKYSFHPVGIVQALDPAEYARTFSSYVEMGYRHIALGGLVPQSDAEIAKVLQAIKRVRSGIPNSLDASLWLHLFGVYRPKLQDHVREAGVSSFDSATYFRKAWLRSGQNYLGVDGKWYAAVRVPVSSDSRTKARLKRRSKAVLEILEKTALLHLHEYGRRERDLNSTLQAIIAYDKLLTRGEDLDEIHSAYSRTLSARVWEQCGCKACSTIGIDAVIFRGYNRNKRRGAHNTRQLFGELMQREKRCSA